MGRAKRHKGLREGVTCANGRVNEPNDLFLNATLPAFYLNRFTMGHEDGKVPDSAWNEECESAITRELLKAAIIFRINVDSLLGSLKTVE